MNRRFWTTSLAALILILLSMSGQEQQVTEKVFLGPITRPTSSSTSPESEEDTEMLPEATEATIARPEPIPETPTEKPSDLTSSENEKTTEFPDTEKNDAQDRPLRHPHHVDNDFGTEDPVEEKEVSPPPESGAPVPGAPENNKLFVETRAEFQGGAVDEAPCDGPRGPLLPLHPASKYFAANTPSYTWAKGKELCELYQMVLAEVESIADQRALQHFISAQFGGGGGKQPDARYYIGANDAAEEGEWVRADGKPLPYSAFHLSQPDDNNTNEDCASLGMEYVGGAVGWFDESCTTRLRVLCMFPQQSSCVNDTVEGNQTLVILQKAQRGNMSLISNMTGRAYFVTDFQLPWHDALAFCANRSLRLFDMDESITISVFRNLVKWQQNLLANATLPPLQFWTSGKFRGSHMSAPVFWHNEATHSPLEDFRNENNFTWSGIFRWSGQKGRKDPGGPHGWRKDLCLSFGFESLPDPVPFARNTNCGLPAHVICASNVTTSDADLD